MEINNKIAIVTGASGGIGLATAKLLGKMGAKVALVARSKDKLEALSKETPKSFAYVADISKAKEVREMVAAVAKHYGTVDILVNNAGRGYFSTLEDTQLNKLQELFDLNLVGQIVAMQEVIPYMKKQKSGAIVNISSNTSFMALPGLAAYSSLKRALNGVSLTTREEVKDDGISVSVVYPFVTVTDFFKNVFRNDDPEIIADRPHSTGSPRRQMPQGDLPEVVAEKIVEAIKTGAAEIWVREFQKN